MANLKKYSIRVLYTFLSLALSLVFISTLYYFNLVNENIYKVFKIIILIVNIFISGFILGRKASSKGYFEGIKLGLLIIVLFLIMSLLGMGSLKLSIIVYYLIILISSILGSMLGILKKKEINS